MRTNLNHNYLFISFYIGLGLLIFTPNQLKAQPSSYVTKPGTLIKSFRGQSTPHVISMDQVGAISSDGLMIKIQPDIIPNNAQNLLWMSLSKKNGAKTVKLMDFSYDNNTIKVKRYYNGNSYYKGRALQTVSLDQLFNFYGSSEMYFSLKIYLHKHWMWFEATQIMDPTINFYHSPFYFGLDYVEDDDNLSTFLSGTENAIVTVYHGDYEDDEGTEFYGYDYKTVIQDIQTNYSNTLSPMPSSISVTLKNEKNDSLLLDRKKILTKELKGKDSTKEALEEINEDLANNQGISNSFTLIPNPTNGLVTISFSTISSGNANVVISSIVGKTVYAETFDVTKGNNQRDLNLKSLGLPAGLYFVNLETPKGVEMKRKLILK